MKILAALLASSWAGWKIDFERMDEVAQLAQVLKKRNSFGYFFSKKILRAFISSLTLANQLFKMSSSIIRSKTASSVATFSTPPSRIIQSPAPRTVMMMSSTKHNGENPNFSFNADQSL